MGLPTLLFTNGGESIWQELLLQHGCSVELDESEIARGKALGESCEIERANEVIKMYPYIVSRAGVQLRCIEITCGKLAGLSFLPRDREQSQLMADVSKMLIESHVAITAPSRAPS